MLNDYILCITPRDDSFRPSSEAVARIIDFLDTKFYLEGPDRDLSALVLLPNKETKYWAEYVQQHQLASVGAEQLLDDEPPIRKRYVHLLYSPTSPDEPYKNYTQLCNMIENLQPRDTPFVAALGRGARAAWKALYCPLPDEDRNRWVISQTIALVSGYHPIWRKIWDNETMHKEWELVTVKAFKVVIGCKLNTRSDVMSIEDFVQNLEQSPEYQLFQQKIGALSGCTDLQLLGFDVR
jgi:hypothetical protein